MNEEIVARLAHVERVTHAGLLYTKARLESLQVAIVQALTNGNEEQWQKTHQFLDEQWRNKIREYLMQVEDVDPLLAVELDKIVNPPSDECTPEGEA